MKFTVYPGEADEYISQWVLAKLKTNYTGKNYKAFGVIKDQELIGGVILDRYNGKDITLHVAATSSYWLSKKFLFELFHYIFEQCGCIRCTGLVDSKNEHALNFDKEIGFIQEGISRKAGVNGDDLIILGMLKEECKWIK